MRLKILKNMALKRHTFLLEVAASSSFKAVHPGQFLHVRIEDSCDPFLRRPLSIHDIQKDSKRGLTSLSILYKVAGKGTQLLAQKKPSSDIDLLGPLGHGFDVSALRKLKKIYIVAGGIGVAPLFFLAKRLVDGPRSTAHRDLEVLIGAKTKDEILREGEFRHLGCSVHVATEDGSKGFKGKVTELLKKTLLSPTDDGLSTICACGPKAMLASVSKIAKERHLTAYVSLEEFMGCGLGACLGCVIRTSSGYQRICHDGPVFNAEDIIWHE